MPSNYRIVEQARDIARAAPMEERRHDRLVSGRLAGWVALEMTCIDYVHVGSGTPVLYDEEIVRGTVVSIQEDGQVLPVIPGASIKGAVRNLAELLLGGGAPDDANVRETAVGGLFGYVGRRETFASRLGFDDAWPFSEAPALGSGKLPQAFQPRKRGGRRIYGPPKASAPKKVPYEIIGSGEKFRTRLHFLNMSVNELGTIFTCLGMDDTFHLRIGGGKFAGLGRVRFEVTGASLRRGYEKPRPDLLGRAEAEAFVKDALTKRLLAASGEAQLLHIRQVLGEGR